MASIDSSILRGAYDIHVHCSPDVIPRAEDLVDLAEAAREAGMAGVGLKDHTTSTAGRAYTLNRLFPAGPRFFSSLALNPPVGGLNPVAVEAALREGVDIVDFPTYSAKHHIDILGIGAPPNALPVPGKHYEGISVLDADDRLKPEVTAILDWITQHDAVLATGHLSPHESLALLRAARDQGVRRMLVTHASECVPGMTVDEQHVAVACGALIEHCFLAVTPCCPGTISLEAIRDQIRQVGVEHVILSSDFGQVPTGPPVAGFAAHVERLGELGFDSDELRTMICDNPARLLPSPPAR